MTTGVFFFQMTIIMEEIGSVRSLKVNLTIFLNHRRPTHDADVATDNCNSKIVAHGWVNIRVFVVSLQFDRYFQ